MKVDSKRLTRFYIVALVLIGLAVSLTHYATDRALERTESSALVINIAGRQRMLSMHISLMLTQLYWGEHQQSQNELIQRLHDHVKLMEKSHNGLIHGDESLSLPKQSSVDISEYYFGERVDLDGKLNYFLSEALRLASVESQHRAQHSVELGNLLMFMESDLLPKVNGLVGLFQVHAEGQLRNIKQFDLMLLVVTLMLLVVEALFIFRPLTKQVMVYIDEIKWHQNQLAALAQARKEFLMNIAHLLRTPLNHILGFSQLLAGKSSTVDDKNKLALEAIVDGGKLLERRINDIYDLVSLEERKTDDELIRFSDLKQLLTDVNIEFRCEHDLFGSEQMGIAHTHAKILAKSATSMYESCSSPAPDNYSELYVKGNDWYLKLVFTSEDNAWLLEENCEDTPYLLLKSLSDLYAGEVKVERDEGTRLEFFMRLYQ